MNKTRRGRKTTNKTGGGGGKEEEEEEKCYTEREVGKKNTN